VHQNYTDITSRIAEPPTWYDQNGTPRYCKFSPDKCPNIYSRTVVLMRIACQNCGKEFDVEMHAGMWDHRRDHPPSKWHYGDPPVHDCVGDTMNCEDLEVLEVWHKNSDSIDWKRITDFEHKVEDSVEWCYL